MCSSEKSSPEVESNLINGKYLDCLKETLVLNNF